jgi:RHS repeat-associated protein
MTYDKLNRMLRHEGPSGVEVFAYRGAEWHRFSQATAAGGEYFLYDGDNVLADIASGVEAFYVTPFLDQNLSITTGGSTHYYSQDGLGSVRTLTDSSGTVKNKYDYLPFGGTHAPGTSVTVEQKYTYTGREKNPSSDLMYYRYRQYDPRVGRFGGRDRLGSEHLYSYVANSPNILVDPAGLSKIPFPALVREHDGNMGTSTVTFDAPKGCEIVIGLQDPNPAPCWETELFGKFTGRYKDIVLVKPAGTFAGAGASTYASGKFQYQKYGRWQAMAELRICLKCDTHPKERWLTYYGPLRCKDKNYGVRKWVGHTALPAGPAGVGSGTVTGTEIDVPEEIPWPGGGSR